jgi:lipoteichoic acid synthase
LLESCAFSGGNEQRVEIVLARTRGLLTRENWVYLSSLLVPLFLYNVALKIVRILTQFDAPGPLGFVDQVRSDVLFNVGYALFWIGVFAAVRGRAARVVSLILFHLATAVMVILSTSAHFFFEKTGSMLDIRFVISSLGSFGEIREVVFSETSALHWLLILGVLCYVVVGPAVITRLVTGEWQGAGRSPGLAWTVPAGAGAMALLLFSLSLVPSMTGAGNAFSRDALANMLVGELATSEVDESKLEVEEPPTETRLVANGSDTPDKRNVVVVLLESTRAESTTPYNESLKTTPFLEKLSKRSLLAERAYTVVPHTSKALVSTLCGVAPPLDTRNTESEPDVIPARCLPELLGKKGYRTVHFQSATEKFERRAALVENFGQDDFYALESMDKEGFEEVNYFGHEDNVMLQPSRTWLERNGDGPFFATYLTVTPHHNYVVPGRYGTERFAPEDDVLNDYLNTIRYQDFFLRNLFRQYKKLGLYEDTIFIVLGDHGEGFGEHGLKQHDNTIYNEGLHIPLLIHDPRRPEARRLEPPVDVLDVLPTVVDMLGYRVGGGDYPGVSMLAPPRYDRTLKASCYHERTCLASIRGDEKYIYFYGNKSDEYYDLSRDPDERHNIIDRQDEEKIATLRKNLLAWEARVTLSYEQRLRREETTTSSR